LPVARWRETWKALFGAGDIGRAWCHHRFATMRNYLSDKCLLAWEDESFVVGVYGDDGRFVPGRAAKWKAGEELMARMEAVQGVQVPEIVGLEEKEEERGILNGNNQFNQQAEQTVHEQDNDTKTVKAAKPPDPNPEPRQSTSFMNLLDDFGLWVPLPRPRFAGYSTGQYRMAA
jgi:hypothetical protein